MWQFVDKIILFLVTIFKLDTSRIVKKRLKKDVSFQRFNIFKDFSKTLISNFAGNLSYSKNQNTIKSEYSVKISSCFNSAILQ